MPIIQTQYPAHALLPINAQRDTKSFVGGMAQTLQPQISSWPLMGLSGRNVFNSNPLPGGTGNFQLFFNSTNNYWRLFDVNVNAQVDLTALEILGGCLTIQRDHGVLFSQEQITPVQNFTGASGGPLRPFWGTSFSSADPCILRPGDSVNLYVTNYGAALVNALFCSASYEVYS